MLLRLVWASVTPHKSGSSVWPQTGQVVVSFPFVFWYFLPPQIPCSFILATPSTLVRELLCITVSAQRLNGFPYAHCDH